MHFNPATFHRRLSGTAGLFSLYSPPPGCYFHPRCPYAAEVCEKEPPAWEEVAPEHYAARHFAKELDLRGIGQADAGRATPKPTG